VTRSGVSFGLTLASTGSAFETGGQMSKRVTLRELNHLDRELVEAAQEACARAYAPYSLFAVGAAVRNKSGTIHTAANVENASYGLTICAEAAALSVANAAGDFTVEAIAVVGLGMGDAGDTSQVVTPCGSCRQIIAEAARLNDSDVRVLCCNGELSDIVVSTIAELLPSAFGLDDNGTTSPSRLWREELQLRVARLIAARKEG
jgi:cytidine deaminase